MKLAVIAFSPFVVKSDHRHTVHGVERPILVAMLRGWHRSRHPPDHQLHHAVILGNALKAGDQLGLHVGNFANMCQERNGRPSPKGPIKSLLKGQFRCIRPTFLSSAAICRQVIDTKRQFTTHREKHRPRRAHPDDGAVPGCDFFCQRLQRAFCYRQLHGPLLIPLDGVPNGVIAIVALSSSGDSDAIPLTIM